MDNVNGALPTLGKTWHGGTPSSIKMSKVMEGKEWRHKNADVTTTGVKSPLDGRTIIARLVRNTSGINLLPGYLVTWEAGFIGKRVDGYARTTAVKVAGVVDPYLPAAGVADDDLFWVITKGPALLKTDLAAGANNSIAEGTVLVSLTAATSQATTSGRVAPQSLTGATEPLANQIMHRIGRAMSAKTTAQTNQDILVDLSIENA